MIDNTAADIYNFDLEQIYSLCSVDIVDSFPCPPGCNDPRDMAYGWGHLWLVDEVTKLIYKIDPLYGGSSDTIPAQGDIPCGLTWVDDSLWQSSR